MVFGGPDDYSRGGPCWSVGRYIRKGMRQGDNKSDLETGRLNLHIYVGGPVLLRQVLGKMSTSFYDAATTQLCAVLL